MIAEAIHQVFGQRGVRTGDAIEFWSGEGCWKPGVIADILGSGSRSLRIHVGNGVYVIRKVAKVRLDKRCLHRRNYEGPNPKASIY